MGSHPNSSKDCTDELFEEVTKTLLIHLSLTSGDRDLEFATDRSQRLLYLAHVRSVVRIGQLAHGGLSHPQSVRKLHLGYALCPHGRIQCKLSSDDEAIAGMIRDRQPPRSEWECPNWHARIRRGTVASASSAILKVSARSLPPVMASGTSGKVATRPPSSSGVS